MVQFPQFRFRSLFIQQRMTASPPPGYPIRLSTDQRMFAPPRRFSQLTTAFLASIRQGIHLKPYSRLTILSFLLKSQQQFVIWTQAWSFPKENSQAQIVRFERKQNPPNRRFEGFVPSLVWRPAPPVKDHVDRSLNK